MGVAVLSRKNIFFCESLFLFCFSTITCAPITCKECVEKSESELRPVYETTTDKPEKSKTSKALLATAKTDLKPVKGKAAVGSEEKGTKAQDESVEEVTKKVTEVKIDAKEKSTNQAKIQKKTNSISSMFSAQNQKAKNTKVCITDSELCTCLVSTKIPSFSLSRLLE